MSKISCDVINDLLPLYVEEVTSGDTNQLVEEHLASCDTCRKDWEIMKKEVFIPANQKENLEEVKSFHSFRKFLQKRKRFTAIYSVAVTILVLFGLQVALVLPRIYIPYHEDDIFIQVEQGKVYANCQLPYYNGVITHNSIEIEVDGKVEQVVMVYYYYSLWSRYVEPLFPKSNTTENPETNRTLLGEMEEITQIYYGEFNKNEDYYGDLPQIIEEIDLIWSDTDE